jgi:hypothetical protein
VTGPQRRWASPRARLAVFAAVCVVALGGTAAYLIAAHERQERRREQAEPVAQTDIERIGAGPRIVFRNTSLRDGYGMVSMVALDDPDGPRAITGTACDRVYATAGDVLCLAAQRGLVTTYTAQVLGGAGSDLAPRRDLPLTGVPSRARLSDDGALAATTSFVAGDSYAATSFSTRTVVSELDGEASDDLETFDLVHQGERIQPIDRNYWGVTFASDDDTFYVTVKFGDRTWLARGQLSARTITTLHADAECPSLSPDGRTIVYKQRGGRDLGQWRLVSYDITTGAVTPLAEERSIDDQVEWLDDGRVIYGVPRTGSAAGISDVWAVPADGTGSPEVLIPQAWSPAVVRTA